MGSSGGALACPNAACISHRIRFIKPGHGPDQGANPINSDWSADVCLETHSGLERGKKRTSAWSLRRPLLDAAVQAAYVAELSDDPRASLTRASLTEANSAYC